MQTGFAAPGGDRGTDARAFQPAREGAGREWAGASPPGTGGPPTPPVPQLPQTQALQMLTAPRPPRSGPGLQA